MTSDRLERAVQSMHGIGMSLATMVAAAIGADKASSAFALGATSHVLLHTSLALFVVSAVAGGHLITQLPLFDGEVEEVMGQKAPLIGSRTRGVLPLKIGSWRAIQHWALIAAIILGVSGALATASVEDMQAAKPAASAAAAPK